jgi:hypothetical protein
MTSNTCNFRLVSWEGIDVSNDLGIHDNDDLVLIKSQEPIIPLFLTKFTIIN